LETWYFCAFCQPFSARYKTFIIRRQPIRFSHCVKENIHNLKKKFQETKDYIFEKPNFFLILLLAIYQSLYAKF
jgi:hypothetical protein